jgi:hypothetical protein
MRTVGNGSKEVVALFDSGAPYSCIEPGLDKKLGMTELLPVAKHFGTAEKKKKVTAKERMSLDFKLNSYTFSDEFMLIPRLAEPVIIGSATLQKWRMKLDFENDEVIIDPRVTKLRLLTFK